MKTHLILASVLIVSCSSDPTSLSKITSSSWRLCSVSLEDSTSYLPFAETNLTLTFHTNGRLEAVEDSKKTIGNWAWSDYSIKKMSVQIKPLMKYSDMVLDYNSLYLFSNKGTKDTIFTFCPAPLK